MPDKFDPYREALVLETKTVWPPDGEPADLEEKRRIELSLHDNPAACSHLEYIRTHCGFCRQITVTQEDLDRLGRDR